MVAQRPAAWLSLDKLKPSRRARPDQQIPGLPAPPLCKFCRVGRRDDVMVRVTSEVPSGEQPVDVGGFGAAGRHEHQQRFDLSTLQLFQRLDQKAMMWCWVVARRLRKLSEASPRGAGRYLVRYGLDQSRLLGGQRERR